MIKKKSCKQKIIESNNRIYINSNATLDKVINLSCVRCFKDIEIFENNFKEMYHMGSVNTILEALGLTLERSEQSKLKKIRSVAFYYLEYNKEKQYYKLVYRKSIGGMLKYEYDYHGSPGNNLKNIFDKLEEWGSKNHYKTIFMDIIDISSIKSIVEYMVENKINYELEIIKNNKKKKIEFINLTIIDYKCRIINLNPFIRPLKIGGLNIYEKHTWIKELRERFFEITGLDIVNIRSIGYLMSKLEFDEEKRQQIINGSKYTYNWKNNQFS